MKKSIVVLGALAFLFTACADPAPVPDANTNTVPSASVTTPAEPIVVQKEIGSQPAGKDAAVPKCEPEKKIVKKVVAKKAPVKKAVVKKHVKKHWHKAPAVVKPCDCPAPVVIVPKASAPKVADPVVKEKEPYEYWLKGHRDPKAVEPVESEKDRCSRKGGWWNTAVPYCEFQSP